MGQGKAVLHWYGSWKKPHRDLQSSQSALFCAAASMTSLQWIACAMCYEPAVHTLSDRCISPTVAWRWPSQYVMSGEALRERKQNEEFQFCQWEPITVLQMGVPHDGHDNSTKEVDLNVSQKMTTSQTRWDISKNNTYNTHVRPQIHVGA